MVTQEDTIFIQGMNTNTTEDELCQHFGSIGIIKVNNIRYRVVKVKYKINIAYDKLIGTGQIYIE